MMQSHPWRERLLELVFPTPAMCVLCQKPLPALSLCPDCLAKLERFAENEGQCRRCGSFGVRAQACDVCRDWPAYYAGNTALAHYEGDLRQAVLRIKFHNEPWRMAGFSPLIEKADLPRADVVVPVPLHPNRLRERGYNQSALLAQLVADALAVPVEEGLLGRVVDTPHQTRLSLSERRVNVAGAFAADPDLSRRWQGARVLVVDDILTTGSTLLHAVRALHEAGFEDLHSMTLASGMS
jgi:competence protein ComFC